MRLEWKIAQRLIAGQQTLCVAESCTGGLLSHRLTNVPGSSEFFIASIISYANTAKTKLLKIPAALIKKDGAVSLSVARLMAVHAARLFDADYAIAITGIAGPTGGTPQKPVGLVFIAVKNRRQVSVNRYIFKGTRLKIKQQACDTALKLLMSSLAPQTLPH